MFLLIKEIFILCDFVKIYYLEISELYAFSYGSEKMEVNCLKKL